ncbi:unnamed protein product [Chrysodeixis includens]|uniref:Carboxylesterase type B domain-containing protein n=1 Tax=Chrysodeixis includens TaxID=689277 RepID=A0A9P0BKS9_CHRIL|nr:unnamed protein product [Chrysodeixis includens]
MKTLTLLLTVIVINQCFCDETIEVSLKQGVVVGKVEKTLMKNEQFYTFKGIPFAEPPVGELRFLPPKPHEGWEGNLKAFKNKPTCMQLSIRSRNREDTGISGSEDCLYISVFTPDVKGYAPVVVFDYNDNFRTGYNGTDNYAHDFFVEEGVVVVTISHRFSVFGYLTTEDDVIKGNSGIRDYILGLEWVKDNIKEFGGDSSRVTLMGSYGGAVMAEMLLYSEKAKGLFSAAILQSGTTRERVFYYDNPRRKAFKLGEVLNITTEDSKELLEGLQKIDAEKLYLSLTETLVDDDEEVYRAGVFPYSPTIEHTDDAIITSLPEDGKIVNDVPLIIGFNSREGIDLISHIIFEPRVLDSKLEETLLRLPLRTNFKFDSNSSIFEEARKEILEFYFQDKSLHYGNILEFGDYVGDNFKGIPIDFAARELAKSLSSSVYYYVFDFRGQLNENSQYMTTQARSTIRHEGATICDELCYMLVCSRIRKTYENTLKMASVQREIKVLKRLVRMWTNFAKTRNPTPEADDNILKGFSWKPIGKEPEPNYLHITKNLRMETNPLGERRHFWDKFLDKYSKLAFNGIVTGDATGKPIQTEVVEEIAVEEIVVEEPDLEDDEEEEGAVEETAEERDERTGGVTVIDDAIPNEEFEAFAPDAVHVEL